VVPYLAFNGEIVKRFQAIIDLEEELFVKLLHSLGEELQSFGARSQVYDYASRNAGADATKFAMAVEAVMPLVLNEQYADSPTDEVVKGVFEGLARVDGFSLWTPSQKKLLKARLKKILSDTTIRLRSKAWGLVLERPCVLGNARILTDLRPVFTSKNPASVEAFTVIHTLVLETQEGPDAKVLHIALDPKDLSSLRDSIARAEHKEKVLNALASRAGVSSLQIK
jgi:hypothetical protein